MGYPDYSHPGERWAPVLGYEGRYLVSTRGRVWGIKRDGQLSEWIDPKGYPRVSLHDERGLKTWKVHHLVLNAFVGPRPPGHECAHRDGNSSNPHLENLLWATTSENHSHKRAHGTARAAFTHPFASLTEADVREIRRQRRAGAQWKEIAAASGKSLSAVICSGIGKSYADFEPETICPRRPPRPRRR